MSEIWCEHCRDHFAEDHYGDDGFHKVGFEYGPTGADAVRLVQLEAVAEAARPVVKQHLEIQDKLLSILPNIQPEWIPQNVNRLAEALAALEQKDTP